MIIQDREAVEPVRVHLVDDEQDDDIVNEAKAMLRLGFDSHEIVRHIAARLGSEPGT